jgi:predicted esterase
MGTIRACWFLLLTVAILIAPTGVQAQYASADRFELGRRLHAFEVSWDAQVNPAARQRAIPFLNAATRAFLFTFRADQIGHDLDRARFALGQDREPEPAVQWAAAAAVRPASRLLDTSATELPLRVVPFYTVEAKLPEGIRLHLRLCRADGQVVSSAAMVQVDRLPLETSLPLRAVAEGDYTLQAEISSGSEVLDRREQTVSLVRHLGARLERLRDLVKSGAGEADQVEARTLRSLVKLLTGLEKKETLETNYPAARLLTEAEAVVRSGTAGQRYYGGQRVGEFWLTLPLRQGETSVRLFAPDAVRQGEPLPLVIALHGAGGSENFFFESYGHGGAVRRCRERGWLLVAPRGSLLEMTPPLADLVHAVSRLYPIDRQRVFVLGHSLGAIQAVSAARRTPDAFAGVAAVAGGGVVEPAPGLRRLPFFIGVGAEDPILRGGGGQLYQSLDRAGVEMLLFRNYEGTEHLTVMEAALDDIFAFFDRAGR